MKTLRDRNHVYLYTVMVLPERKEVQVEACNIHQVAVKLKRKLEQVQYRHKEIVK